MEAGDFQGTACHNGLFGVLQAYLANSQLQPCDLYCTLVPPETFFPLVCFLAGAGRGQSCPGAGCSVLCRRFSP